MFDKAILGFPIMYLFVLAQGEVELDRVLFLPKNRVLAIGKDKDKDKEREFSYIRRELFRRKVTKKKP